MMGKHAAKRRDGATPAAAIGQFAAGWFDINVEPDARFFEEEECRKKQESVFHPYTCYSNMTELTELLYL